MKTKRIKNMNKKLLILALEGVMLAAPVYAEEARYCQTDMQCAPCDDDAREGCRRVNGKRIDRGHSLGARSAPGMNAEREIGTRTFVLADAPDPAADQGTTGAAPQAMTVATRKEVRRVRETQRQPASTSLSEPLFASGGSQLTPRMQARLDALVAELAGREELSITVVGHTDPQRLSAASRARYVDNYGLGLARARAAADYLAPRLGLGADRIHVDSRGPDVPVADNDSPEGMAQNRRIEVVARYALDQVVERQEVVEVAVPVAAPAAVQPAAPLRPRSCQEVLASRQAAPEAPFRITIDGVPQDEPGVTDPDIQRCTDVALAQGELQLRYDPLEQSPALNAHAWPNAVARGQSVSIQTYSNYAAFIERAEIRLFPLGASPQSTPLAVLPVQIGGVVDWTPSQAGLDAVEFVLRVYDREGRFDETRMRRLDIVDRQRPPADAQTRQRELLAGYGENNLAFHNIPVRGGAVTANGDGIQPGERVLFLGSPVPVDANGRFAARQILPGGPHVVEVRVEGEQGELRRAYSRNLSIATDDWFYLALADLTVGRNRTTGPAKLVTADTTDHFDNEVYVDGRLAFYLKGKVKGEWLLTASADTREQPLRHLFSNFDAKDPRYLLRRLDPDRYYPVYGDDSTTIDDAPTQGKFFVRIEKGQGPDSTQAMWGSFQTSLTGTEFSNFNRALYGGRARYVSEAATQYGERRARAEVFAAEPGTLQSREEFRGTGGSLYWLRHQDITRGAERVWVEVRDKDTGLILSSKELTPVQDYEVNPLQGRILLRDPLASTAPAGSLVVSGNLAGHPQYLIVTYEYAPGVTVKEDLVLGGRASVWVNDHLQVGASGLRQDDAGQKQDLRGLDATLRYRPGTYVKVEGARTEGVGSGAWSSLDGGMSFTSVPGGVPGRRADAKRVEAAVDFSEVSKAKGRATLYWQDRDKDFTAPGQITAEAVKQQGASLVWQVIEGTDLLLKLDEKDATSQTTRAGEVNVSHRIDERFAVGLGLRSDEMKTRVPNASSILSGNGRRHDAVVRLDYTPPKAGSEAEAEDRNTDWSAYGYVQGTLKATGDRRNNSRVGVGGERRVNDRLSLGGELSDGDGGWGALLSADWRLDDRRSLYSSYNFTPDRTDDGYRGRAGMFTAGAKTRFSDSLAVYGEERYQHGDGPSGLTHAFGLDYAPNDRWTYGAKLEAGDLSDPLSGDLRRRAVGVSLGYRQDATRYAGALEYRHEKGTGKRETWLMRNNLGYQINPDWRFLGRLDFSFSDGGAGAMPDADYIELVTGYAWRPVDNDRWNTLFKYTYLYNLPSPGQVDASGSTLDYAQKSHVLSVDTIHDLKPWVSVGGKLGVRRGELKYPKAGGKWFDSTAWLGILRADWHWVHEWDVLTELRYLSASAAKDHQSGALVGVYRHLGPHFKLGVGYNFTDFSDDLTNMDYRSRGWFVNLIGKM